jgi:hypothetical protein
LTAKQAQQQQQQQQQQEQEDSSPIPSQAKRLMKKVFASARGSAILATLTGGISKLSGLRWIQKVDNLKNHRSDVSEIKLKRTDTTLDLLILLAF